MSENGVEPEQKHRVAEALAEATAPVAEQIMAEAREKAEKAHEPVPLTPAETYVVEIARLRRELAKANMRISQLELLEVERDINVMAAEAGMQDKSLIQLPGGKLAWKA